MATYAIGDPQGCYSQVLRLQERIHAIDSDPQWIFVGDIVNRGPESLASLRGIRALGSKATVLLGNHDLHLLAAAQGVRPSHAPDTLDEILHAPDRDELLDWLRHRPLAHLSDGYLLVHAGVLPQWTLQQTLQLAGEVEAMLQGPRWSDFLHGMYGNQPARWDDGLTGMGRLRCIVNALTRIRYCTADGTMDLAAPESGGATSDLLPWFDVPGRKTTGTPIVFGHWSTLGLTLRPDLIGLDTGCVWGRQLTAVRLQDRAIFQVDCPRYLQQTI